MVPGRTRLMFRRLLYVLLLCLALVGCDIFIPLSPPPGPGVGPVPTVVMPPAPAPATATATAAPTETPAVPTFTPAPLGGTTFDGEAAFVYLEEQVAFGPRWPGSPGHIAAGDHIIETLQALGWAVEEQPLEYQGVQGRNIIGRANEGAGPVIILGAHYDTRRVADETAGAVEQQLPSPGAVDGASGVAVLLELARTLDLERIPHEIWLAFFDLEDNGNEGLPGWDWIVGSTYMAENLTITPQAVVVVDMVGDADQQFYYDGNSDQALRETLWNIAAGLGYGASFIPELKYTMIDDHLPFARRGIPAVDIIDFDYPYWHTVEDTSDKASADSLHRVGRTVESWLEDWLPNEQQD